jgi:hypothetical protein
MVVAALGAGLIVGLVGFLALVLLGDVMPKNPATPQGVLFVDFTSVLTVASLAGCFAVLLRLVGRLFGGGRLRGRSTFLAGFVMFAVIAVALGLTLPEPPTVVQSVGKGVDEGTGDLGFEALLVVDPGDPVSRAAIREAASPGALAPLPGPAWHLRWAVATPDPGGEPATEGRWTLRQPFTSDAGAAAKVLRELSPRDAPATATYGRLLSDAISGLGLGWTPAGPEFPLRSSLSADRFEHAIVLFLERLPTDAELDRGVPASERESRRRAEEPCRARRPSGMTFRQCVALFGAPDTGLGSQAPVKWLTVIQQLELDRLEQRTRLLVVTPDTDPARVRAWRSWLPLVGGKLLRASNGDEREHPLALVRSELTESAARPYEQLAFDYRPHLRLDSGEVGAPIDVDEFLARDGPHEGCPGRGSGGCQPITDGYAIVRGGFQHLDLSGGSRSGGDLPHDIDTPGRGRIYFHPVVTERSGDRYRIALDYWWFFRFNVSPVRSQDNCLAGLSISDATCFDHEGDWEGVTVTLDVVHGKPHIAGVTYAAHKGARPLRPGAFKVEDRTHPVVYVARGSHASYPRPCAESHSFLGSCRQDAKLLGRIRLPEGPHDGMRPWAMNDDDTCRPRRCVAPLPVTPSGAPALWNAFDGLWGAAECSFIAKFCVKTEGPPTPARQRRYRHPSA